jgi:RHS repeat-associated protein
LGEGDIVYTFGQMRYLTGNGNTEDGLYFYHGNHLSSTQLITDINANISQAVLYTPWGSVIKEYKADWMLDTIPRYLFNAKILDEENGMYYYEARYYSDENIMFTARDPLFEEKPWLNPYHYCSNNPVNRIDPTGLSDGSPDDYRIFADGTIEVTKTDDDFDRFYLATNGQNGNQQEVLVGQFNKNEKGLIQLPSTFSFTNPDFGTSFGFQVKSGNEANSYIRGDAFAALIGALATTSTTDLTIIAFSKADATSPPPSKSHKNGINGDLRYFQTDYSNRPTLLTDKGFDMDRQNKFNDALYTFGWKNMLSEQFTPFGEQNSTILNRTSHYNKSRHHNHLHLQGFRPNLITK